jgi:hypothetical protein
MTQAVALAQQASTGVSQGFKNRIINGGMTIDQRNAGASITPASNITYALDRWVMLLNVSSKYSVQQNAGSVTPPVGFSNYMGFTSTSSYSIGAGEVFACRQSIEGFNFADCNWGTANAKTVTLSFWVRSSLTGTFGGTIKNSDETRSYPFTYTISSANTWEQKSVTIPGDTSGTWVGATNGIGVSVLFSLGAGSNLSGTANTWASANLFSATGAVSVVGTNGATLYLTGVQLEVGSTATSFDYRPYGTEFQLCQRYFYKNICTTGGAQSTPLTPMGWSYSVNSLYVPVIFPQPMRAIPTLSRSGCQAYNPTIGGPVLTAMTFLDVTPLAGNVNASSSSGFTNNLAYWISPLTVATDFIAFSAEL